jgi:penicillin-binding protein 1A
MEELLRGAVNRGTGRAARLSIANYGKTGTTQDNRDALFVGYAGDLVVGVWVGNDDNTPLAGVHGGGVPARIWRDFMSQALGTRGAPEKPKPNPSGPVEPMDVPEGAEIELDNGTTLRIDQGAGVGVSTQIQGVPIDLRLGRDGLQVNGSDAVGSAIQNGRSTPVPTPRPTATGGGP